VGFQDRFQSIIGLWKRLTEPADSVSDMEQRQLSRVVMGVMLATALVLLIVLPARYLSNIDARTPIRFFASFLGILAVLFAYWQARQGRNRAAIYQVVALATALIIIASTFLTRNTAVTTLYYLNVVSLFAGLFLSLRTAAVVSFIHIVLMLFLPNFSSVHNLQRIINGPLSFTLLLMLTVLVFSWYRTRLEAQKTERLIDSEMRYRVISELISDYAYSYSVDENGEIHEEWMAGSFTRITGYQWNEMNRFVLFHPDYVERAKADVKRVLKGESVNDEYLILTKNGQERWLRLSRQPVWDTEKNRVVRFYAVAQDVTQRREAEEQKLRMAVQQGRLGVIGDFVQAVSHDFRTSLATIETNRYLIEKTFNSINPLKTISRLTVIQQSVFHLTQQLENLHLLSALIAPKTETSMMNKLVNDLILQQIPAAHNKRISLTFSPEPYLSPVLADIGEVQRALGHILMNAINYTPENGKVNVRTYQANKMVSVEIRDSGIGIQPDELEHIFDFFYRADVSRPVKSGGVGLGLSLVRMIAEAHNGTVKVTSTPGAGSTFTFSLPALSVESRAAS
jgi:PAS domain S-box-containing protein